MLSVGNRFVKGLRFHFRRSSVATGLGPFLDGIPIIRQVVVGLSVANQQEAKGKMGLTTRIIFSSAIGKGPYYKAVYRRERTTPLP